MSISHQKQLILLTLFVALATPAPLAAQATANHPRYKLIDLGTLGGPHSYGSINGDEFRLLNDSGVVASYADTSTPDPNAPCTAESRHPQSVGADPDAFGAVDRFDRPQPCDAQLANLPVWYLRNSWSTGKSTAPGPSMCRSGTQQPPKWEEAGIRSYVRTAYIDIRK